jgi:hypothetical protein
MTLVDIPSNTGSHDLVELFSYSPASHTQLEREEEEFLAVVEPFRTSLSSQKLHFALLKPEANFPTSHTVHAVAETPENVPGEQGRHSVMSSLE